MKRRRRSRSSASSGRPTASSKRGQELPEVVKFSEVSEVPIIAGGAYGGMRADDVKRLKVLEVENSRLKRVAAD